MIFSKIITPIRMIIWMLFDSCFYSLVNKPIRTTNTSATLLDHIWTNLFFSDITAGVLFQPVTDH